MNARVAAVPSRSEEREAERAVDPGLERDPTELGRLRELVLQRDRFATIGQLAAGVAHEVNNPLSFVKANLGLMDEALAILRRRWKPPTAADEELLSELVDLARQSAVGVSRIEAIVGNLRGIARTRPGERASFCPAQAVREAVQFFVGARHCPGFVTIDMGELPEVVGEAGGLCQVVLNLLNNAWDAVQGKGKVHIVGRAAEGVVRVSVADDGPGIPLAARPHVFEFLFTTKDAGKGTGLGLYISRQIVTASGGTMRFDTGPHGTTFFIELPVSA